MNTNSYLYLIKTIEDNKVQLVSSVDEKDGVIYMKGKVCAVIRRYSDPVDIDTVHFDIDLISNMSSNLPQQKENNGKIIDHLGNHFSSLIEMCGFYSISLATYQRRMKQGLSLEEALTGKKVFDHLGKEYASKLDMCNHYNIPLRIFNARINAGKTLEEALTSDLDEQYKQVTDHLGNKYFNVKQMCEHYGVPLSLYCQRRYRGWTLERALTKNRNKPIQSSVKDQVSDHLGNTFSSIKEMCNAYGIDDWTYSYRIGLGYSQEKALTCK